MTVQPGTITALSKDTTKPVTITADELGVTGGYVFKNFITGEAINFQAISYRELKRMTETDGQTRALLNMIVLPIVSARWDVVDETIDDIDPQPGTGMIQTKNSDERDFIHDMLFKPKQEGGMSIPFRQVIAYMAMAVRDGYKAFEKVFKLDDRGRVVLKKLAFRDNTTVSLRIDDHGDFDGFIQRTTTPGGAFINVTIEKPKALLFTFGKENGNLYGSPLFLPIYYHFDKKHKLYYISHVAHQVLAIPPRIGIMPPGTTDTAVRNRFLKDLSTLGFNAAMVMPAGCEVHPFESRRPLSDFLPLIQHHDEQMSKVILGQFINLTTAATGKLSSEQSELFILGLKYILFGIEELINDHLIPQLIDFNFSSGVYPKLRARAFTDAEQALLEHTFETIMVAIQPHTTPEFNVALERQMADHMNIKSIAYDDILTRVVDQAMAMDKATLERAQGAAKTALNPPKLGPNQPFGGKGKPGPTASNPRSAGNKTKFGKEGNK